MVPKGQARIRTQMSAAHTREHLDRAIDAFIRIGRELGVIGRLTRRDAGAAVTPAPVETAR